MEVKRYIYQSPYNSPIQIGREDTSMKNNSAQTLLAQESNQSLDKSQTFAIKVQKGAELPVNKTLNTQQSQLDLYV